MWAAVVGGQGRPTDVAYVHASFLRGRVRLGQASLGGRATTSQVRLMCLCLGGAVIGPTHTRSTAHTIGSSCVCSVGPKKALLLLERCVCLGLPAFPAMCHQPRTGSPPLTFLDRARPPAAAFHRSCPCRRRHKRRSAALSDARPAEPSTGCFMRRLVRWKQRPQRRRDDSGGRSRAWCFSGEPRLAAGAAKYTVS